VERETGIPEALTDTLIHALQGADHLGSLLKIDTAVDEALAGHEVALSREIAEQGDLFTGFTRSRVAIGRDEAKATLLDRLEGFLAKHTGGDDLGLRLRGEQLATGVRFVRFVREGTYDLVVANPPYQGASKMTETRYVDRTYPLGKADLYAAFLLRGLGLVRNGGVSAMLTMRNWIFMKQYSGLREHILDKFDVRALGDFAVGAFDEVPNDLLSVTASVLHRSSARSEPSIALQPTPPTDTSYDRARTSRKRAATLCHEGNYTFDPNALKVVPEWPLIYWWTASFLDLYARTPKLGEVSPARSGAQTSNDVRFLRRPWEVNLSAIEIVSRRDPRTGSTKWAPYIAGAKGLRWIDPLSTLIDWEHSGLSVRVFNEHLYGSYSRTVKNEDLYWRPGVAFSTIGNDFGARLHHSRAIFGSMGASVFPEEEEGCFQILCLLNSSLARRTIEALNPGIHFTGGDINRLPIVPIADSSKIGDLLIGEFASHESVRETSHMFCRPGPSPWRHAQDWAQAAVDRPEGAPLAEYVAQFDPEPPTDHLSFALGVALGRFGPAGSDAEGILDPSTADLSHALPDGILFLDTTLDAEDHRDGLGHPAAAPLHAAWAQHGPAIGTRRGLREWLALDFFKDVHKGMYENRPIHWPLSSAGRTFVAWVNIHRMNEQTLQVLLADHLAPALTRIDGELADLRSARAGADRNAARAAERRYDRVLKNRDELQDFIDAVEQCADRGAPPTDRNCPDRERDARYAPDLDDGVMINSAALWPLLDPQWKDPKKWWAELAAAQGRKDYDWSHLAMRYWPNRVDRKCQQDPSLGVAHGCFWRYHPERAWSWELRLQDEISPDFTIEEAPYRPGDRDLGDLGDGPHRDAFLRDNPTDAINALEKEAVRRMGRGSNWRPLPEMRIRESGLWTDQAAKMWDLESRLIKKQEAEIRIVAPDEPVARADFEAENPARSRARKMLLADLVPDAGFFTESQDAHLVDEAAESEEDAG
jgi:hypothetical protein